MSRIKKGFVPIAAIAAAFALSMAGAVPAFAGGYEPDAPTFSHVPSVSCVDEGLPQLSVNVSVDFPEGNEPATLGVYFGDELEPLEPGNPTRQVTASGDFTFTGRVPVGEVTYMVGFANQAPVFNTVTTESCAPELTPPTYTGLTLSAACVEGTDKAEVSAVVTLNVPEHPTEFTVAVAGPGGANLDLVGIDGGTYYFAGTGSPGTQTYTVLLDGKEQESKQVTVPECAVVTPPVTPDPDPEPEPQPQPEQPKPEPKPEVKVPDTNKGVADPGATGDIVEASAAGAVSSSSFNGAPYAFGALGVAAMAGLAYVLFFRRKVASDS